MKEDIVSKLRISAAISFEDEYGVWPPESPLMADAANEIERLQKYRDVVYYISNDYHELSYEKAKWQRDDWKKRCIELINDLEKDGDNYELHV